MNQEVLLVDSQRRIGISPVRHNDLGTLASKKQDSWNGRISHNQAPAESTNAENYYYLKQMHARTPMVVKLVSGQEIVGVFEWYDKNCIKVVQSDGIETVVLKHEIKYVYKQNRSQN